MHFSALTVLACAIVAVAAHPGHDNLVNVDAPVDISNVGNGNTVKVLNGVLNHKRHGHGLVVDAPIHATNIGNDNHSRDVASVAVPVTIEEIFDCNNIAIANNILNNLAVELGRAITDLGITAQNILDCNTENWHTLVDALYAHVGKAVPLGKRTVASIYAPVTLKDILNCNTVEIANDLLNHLAAELKCTVIQLGITVEDLLAARPDNAQALLNTLKSYIAKLGKRDLINIKAPVDISNVANYNVVDILNNVGNGGKRDLLKVTAPITATNIANGNKVGVLNDVLNGHGKRDAANVKAPVDVNNVANYNVVDILNNVGNGGKRDFIDVEAPIDVSNVLNGNEVDILNNILKRDAANIKAPVDVNNVANYNVVDILNNVGNGGKRDLIDLDAPIDVSNVLNGNKVAVLNDIL
ncbi:hypothetical protein FIBSPDRAFT_966887 [Athelia psychrophila]|uniref:Uncharacterized protein n=1 Tax=Athelia psychrophila TaxID=1759441 RepID=A0A167WC37_9AGAM|nr:hypothetical protein FIBSPDRAFT_966887 [Fibularhizoctonia sp. CBS 109695]